uniref:Uncharacterized protein n=1 Tax=Steinernema glaseri TaxID=37863 RepID=A0A1I8AIY2_9BILA
MSPRLLLLFVLLLQVVQQVSSSSKASAYARFRHPEMALRYSGPSPFRLLKGEEVPLQEKQDNSAKVDPMAVDSKTRLFLLFLQSMLM